MLIKGGKPAAPLAALLADRDVLRGAPVDLSLRVEALQDLQKFLRERPYQPHRPSLERVRQEQRRLAKSAPDGMRLSLAQMAALAYPDRIGARRKGDTPRYLLSGGSGAIMASEDPMASAPFIVATDLDGDRKDAKIRQAIQISAAELRELYEDRIAWVDSCEWSDREKRVVARSQERFGAIALQDRIWKDPSDEAVSRAMLAGVRQLGLPWSDAARRFAARVTLARAEDPDLPSVAEADLLASAEDWLLPYLQGVKTAQHWKNFDLLPPLRSLLDYNQTQHLDRSVPAHFTTPLGRKIPIDYSGEAPEIQLRLQELFGQTTHPTVAGTPLRVTLLSPAQRPVQTTMDIPGFWDSSYADVRKDMRGRYPKHPWPEDPRQADPTLRAKPRG
jgi:ATP-dependent helicase HrpB